MENETERIRLLLKDRYRPPEWALFYELRNVTGYARSERYFDAFVMNTFPSKKFLRIAFEIKVRKSDFIREVENPVKREEAMRYSNQFYFAAPKGLIEPRELPEGTGLMEAQSSRLVTKVVAPQRNLGEKTFPMDFAAVLLRRITEAQKPSFSIFRYAGRDLTDEDLMKILEEKMEADGMGIMISREAQKRADEVLERFKERNPYRKLAEVICEELKAPIEYPPEPHRLREWLQSQRNGIPLDELRSLKYHIERLAERFPEILERWKDEDGS